MTTTTIADTALPTVTVLKRDADRTRFRLIGGDLAPGWAAREGKEAWCEMSVWDSRPDCLEAYGGEVWPAAWPNLFESHRGTAQSGSFVTVTPLGQALLASALEKHSAMTSD